ncbi:nitrous oxide reductase family maturation protein NosD [Ekhidna sp.]|uniref:nitrous oxide reductase family maturation protein NosD n=1 Tax=Ekhidna sp. TaxID=2608089 RepID=UPI003B59F007
MKMVIRILHIALSFVILSAKATVIEVSEGGSVTIETAIKKCEDGDTVLIRSGTYTENSILVNKRITILGDDRPVIDAENEAADIFIITVDSVKIMGLILKNVATSYLKEYAAIKINRAAHGTISNNRILDCFFGVYLAYAKNYKVIDNEIIGNAKDEASAGNAIHAWKASNLEIAYNEVTTHRDGIYFEFVDDSEIHHNNSYRNLRYGLHFMFSNRDVYHHNEFTDSGAGVAVMFSKNIHMDDNIFKRNWGGASYGLLLKEISDGSISNNKFIQNTIGILAEGASRLKMNKNQFTKNGTALDMKGNCLENEVSENNFLANTFDVVTNSKYNTNSYSANYWSNYSGYDLDRDGIGDIPYRPVNLYAKITHEIPSATIMLQSFFVQLLDLGERLFPQMIPEELIDEKPMMRPYNYNL